MVACMTERSPQTLAEAVLTRRCDLGLTQTELAKKAGIALRTVQNIEAGKRPQPIIFAAVARALDMSSAELRQATEGAEPEAQAS
jgi:transcriptional regulator with XRE-family HTH domain